MKNKYSLALFISIILLTSCDTFTGCGEVVAVYAPEPIVIYKYYNGYKYACYTGRYYYPVSVQKENGKRYKIYTSYDTWYRAHYEKITICD